MHGFANGYSDPAKIAELIDSGPRRARHREAGGDLCRAAAAPLRRSDVDHRRPGGRCDGRIATGCRISHAAAVAAAEPEVRAVQQVGGTRVLPRLEVPSVVAGLDGNPDREASAYGMDARSSRGMTTNAVTWPSTDADPRLHPPPADGAADPDHRHLDSGVHPVARRRLADRHLPVARDGAGRGRANRGAVPSR